MSTEMNKKFSDDPLAFMHKYAVDPGNDLGDTGKKIAKYEGHDGEGNFFLRSMDPTKRVGYLDFNKAPKAVGITTKAGVVAITGSLAPHPGYVKSYYLPWAQNAIIRMSIPARGTALVDDDVRVFFTAAISGCSIFVKGTPQAPIVMHAGGNTGKSDPSVAAKFWRDMANSYAWSGGSIAEVNKTNYVSDVQGDQSTSHSREFEQWLKDNAKGDLKIDYTAPTGRVMGIRDLKGDWSFYLQENITIFHSKFKRILGIKTKKSIQGARRPQSVP